MEKAIFLDRDGTINQDIGHLFSKDKLVFIPRAIRALKLLKEKYLLFIVTNQAGIGENVFSKEDYLKFDEHFRAVLRENDIHIEKTYCCPHKKEEKCVCHKPGTYFMEKAVKEYGLDIANSYVIGDHPHDVEMGAEMGAKTIYLLTGHGRKHRGELSVKPDHISNDLFEAAEWVLDHDQKDLNRS